MKNFTFLCAATLISASASAQLYSDDFESYAVGTYMGPTGSTWTTWSGSEGGAEDVQVTNAQANSGTKSIYFSSTAANGGPQDVIVDFGQQYTSGMFTYESAFYINPSANGYFNFQGTTTPGTTWSLNCNMANGVLTIDDGVTADLAVTSYDDATWFTLRIEANLTTGRWQAYKDGVCFGVWANSVNQIASIDLYPIQGSQYYVDDIMFDHVPYTAPSLNATIIGYNVGGKIAGLNVYPTVKVKNTGTTAITSFDVTVTVQGTPMTENVTGVNLTAGQSMDVVFTNGILLGSTSDLTNANVSNVNGGNDGDPTDDDACGQLDPVVPAAGKVVVGEEATGTWCPWCVRGTVFMEQFEEFGQYWAGIAVHNGDPMTNATYDGAIGALISGYPSALVDRGNDVDPSAMSTDFYARLVTPPTAIIVNSSTWNSTTRELAVTVTADFQMAANNQYKLACVITEDGVSSTDAGYAQANAYAGGANGPMGGFELLPNPVPAAQMVYDHVAREILPSFAGMANSFPATVNAGEQHAQTFTFTLDPSWNEANIHIIGLLIAPDGRIDNAGKSVIGGNVGVEELTTGQFRMYPNPSNTVSYIETDFNAQDEVSLRVLNLAGQVIDSKAYGQVEAGAKLPVVTQGLQSGMYIVELTVGTSVMTQQLVVQ
jgi:hypothetical protein